MKFWLKNIIGILLIIISFASVIYGELDDSPGLMLIGVIIFGISLFILVKRFKKKD